MNKASLTGPTTAVTLQPLSSTDQTLRDIRDKIGNRGLGGKIATWVKNQGGISTKEKATLDQFRQSITQKLGSAEAAAVLFKEIGISPDKPLSARKAQAAIDRAEQFVADRDSYHKDYSATVAQINANNAKAAAAAAKALANGRPVVAKAPETPESPLSDSAIMLRGTIASKLKGSPADNLSAANAIIGALNLGDCEEVTDAHVAKAHQLAIKYEEARGTDLFNALGQKPFNTAFKNAWKDVVKNGNDPRAELLSSVELVALNIYTRPDFGFVNKELREGNPSERTLAISACVISGLQKLPPFEGYCFRGTNMPQTTDQSCQTGATFTDKAFYSSSANRGESFDGAHQVMIFSKEGRDISFLSMKQSEKEILFPPGHNFRVLDRTGSVDYGGASGTEAFPSKNGPGGEPSWGQAKIVLA